MPTVDYTYELPYTIDPRNDRSFSRLLMRLANPEEPGRTVDTWEV